MLDNTPDFNSLHPLDKTRHTGGTDNMKLQFRTIAGKNTYEAVRLLNDESLHFASLFALRSVIHEFGLYRYLNFRNMNALEITDRILNGKPSNVESLPQAYRQKMLSLLKWICETGRLNDGTDAKHEEVIDKAALILIKSYKDKTILSTIVDMIFERHRRGAYTYDLIWACFESCDPAVLIMLSDRLASSDEKDAELAGKLLKFIPCSDRIDSEELNLQRISWIHENYPFLYYTGESLHQSCRPVPFMVSLEAKYICKPVSPEKGEFLEPLSRDQYKLLTSFSALDDYSKELLADCSSLLNKTNRNDWTSWLRSPVSRQFIHALRMRGEVL